MYLCVLSKLPYLHGYLIIAERSEECLVIYYVWEALAIVCATRCVWGEEEAMGCRVPFSFVGPRQ